MSIYTIHYTMYYSNNNNSKPRGQHATRLLARKGMKKIGETLALESSV